MNPMELNDIQKKIVKDINSQVIVKAGPGTGKTFLIIEKIKYLIKSGIKENNILAITFSKKASEEIKNRLSDSLGLFHDVNIETFHSFCEKILREHYKKLNIKKDFVVMDRMESFVFLSDHIFDFNLNLLRPLSNPDKEIDKILSFFSNLQDEGVTPEEFLKLKNKDEYFTELAYLYENLLNFKIKESKLEFNDLIYLVLKLFAENKNILDKYREKIEYILVDEFQDTNHIQNELLLKLSDRVTVVGDKNQSIYKFRGASLSNFNSFKSRFPECREYTLSYNYRSYQDIIDAAYFFIQDKDVLQSNTGTGKDSIKVKEFSKNSQELNFIKDQIIELSKNGVDFSEIAILLRSNSYLNDFAEVLINSNIPIYLRGSLTFESSSEFKDLSAVIYFMEKSSDNISFLRLLNMDCWGFSQEEFIDILHKINSWSKNVSFYDNFVNIIENAGEEDIIVKSNKVLNFYNILKELLDSPKTSIVDMINNFLDKSFYFDTLHRKKDSKFRRSNVDKFIAIIEKLQTDNVNYYSKYLKNISKISSLDDDISLDNNFNSVTISTIHSVKGLEFKHVFIPYLVKDRFPLRNRGGNLNIDKSLLHEQIEEENYLEEEKRLFFVALTRAKESIHITYSQLYDGNKKPKDRSIFLDMLNINSQKIDYKNDFLIKNDPEFIVPENSIPKKFSYSQLSCFKTCPLQYYYEYILNIKKQPKLVFEYGNVIHDTLKNYLNQDKSMYNDNLLEDIYFKRWESVNLSVFKGEEHIESYKKKGLESIKNNIDLIKPKSERIVTEQNFETFIDGKNKINGRLDRLDFFEDGSVSIVDYKTGSSSSQDTSSSNLQLGMYSILVKDVLKKPIRDLKLIFIDECKEISIDYDKIDINKVKEEILDLIDKIQNLEVRATPSFSCDFCEYRGICYKR